METAPDTEWRFRAAVEEDLPLLVAMLAADKLGQQREDNATPINAAYLAAFRAIAADPHNELVVVEIVGRPAGLLQLTFIPNLTYTGSWRCQVEGVRIHQDFRGRGVGTRLLQWAIQRARERGCRLVQLTTDKHRPEALRFYKSLGFQATHEGLKLKLT